MSVVTVITGDLQVNGTVSANSLIPSDGTVTNAKISATSTTPVDADKLEHITRIPVDFGIAATAAPAADVEKIVYRANGAAVIRSVKAILFDTGTTSDVKFDLKKATAGSTTKNSVLSATINFTHADTDNTAKSGTLSSSTLTTGDTLVAVMDYTSATGVAGPALFIEIDEAAN